MGVGQTDREVVIVHPVEPDARAVARRAVGTGEEGRLVELDPARIEEAHELHPAGKLVHTLGSHSRPSNVAM